MFVNLIPPPKWKFTILISIYEIGCEFGFQIDFMGKLKSNEDSILCFGQCWSFLYIFIAS